MYHVSRMDDDRAATPPDYLEHSTGFRRQDLIGRETGSHHMTMSTAILDPGGRIEARSTRTRRACGSGVRADARDARPDADAAA